MRPVIAIEPLSAPFGATLTGLDIASVADEAPDGAVAEALRAGLAEHALLVLATIDCSDEDLLALARAFGRPDLGDRPSANQAAGQSMAPGTSSGATSWVADGSFRSTPPDASLSYAIEVPRRGGQTQFADMRKALRLLPPDDRADMAELRLAHRFSAPVKADESDESVEHPWIRVDADGTESLYMGSHASHVVGRSIDESRRWFDEIEAQLPVHDVFYEHRWQPNDLIIYDSRIVAHRTLGYDIANERRIVRTITVTAR